jgi:glycosyltransferase involved in cell wall biosynthesis
MERVSVIIPAYNAERTLRETLESVLAQTYRDLEVIVVDDGSTDNTAATVRDYAEQGRIQYIERENGGIAAGRNTGLQLAKGKYVSLLDHDDLWDPDKIERQVRFLEESGADFIFCYVRRLGLDGRIHDFPVEKIQGVDPLEDLLKHNMIYSSTVLFKRSVLTDVGFLDETFRYNEDWDWYLRVATGAKLICMPETLVTRRDQPTSFSITYTGKYMYYVKIFDKHQVRFEPARRKVFRKNMGNKCYTDAVKLIKAGHPRNALAAYKEGVKLRKMLIFRLHKLLSEYLKALAGGNQTRNTAAAETHP